MKRISLRRSLGLLMVWSLLLSLLAAPLPVQAYTPDSPKVRNMAERAVRFLETSGAEGNAGKLGGETLIALAIHKYYRRYHPQQNQLRPKVVAALDRAQRSADQLAQEDNYSLGIALVFLTEVDPEGSRQQIQSYAREMLRRQKPHGGWGYDGATQGDTSQTQYAVLSLWSARQAGVEVPRETFERVAMWLIRTQDPSGGWGYQGRDPGNLQRVPQEEVTHSLHAAGTGSLYVCAQVFAMAAADTASDVDDDAGVDLPPALQLADDQDPANTLRPLAGLTIDRNLVQRALRDAQWWYDANFQVAVRDWQHYYLYGLERYQTFRDWIDGRRVAEPDWYNQAVDYLDLVQDRTTGSFGGGAGAAGGPDVDTAFATLLLIRSTQATRDRVGRQGALRGGKELPSDLSNVRQAADGSVVAPKQAVTVREILAVLEDQDIAALDRLVAAPDELRFRFADDDRNSVEATLYLRRTLRSRSWQARLLSAKILGEQADLDNVPALIYALTDPDPQVVKVARDGLRHTSRRVDGFGLPDQPSADQLRQAIADWKAWYRTLRPDAEFLDQ